MLMIFFDILIPFPMLETITFSERFNRFLAFPAVKPPFPNSATRHYQLDKNINRLIFSSPILSPIPIWGNFFISDSDIFFEHWKKISQIEFQIMLTYWNEIWHPKSSGLYEQNSLDSNGKFWSSAWKVELNFTVWNMKMMPRGGGWWCCLMSKDGK